MKNIEKPQLLIVKNEDYIGGFEKGFYPKETEILNSKDLEVVDKITAQSKYEIAHPAMDKIYMQNEFTGKYLLLDDNSIGNTLVQDQTVIYKSVLKDLGARRIMIQKSTLDEDHIAVGGNIGLNKKALEGKLGGSHTRDNSINIIATLEGEYPKREPKPAHVIRDFALNHGIGNDAYISNLIEILERDHYLEGKETIEITYLTDLQSATNVAAELKAVGAFGIKADFNYSSEKVHVKKCTLIVDFGSKED